jgi:hypothetical protein
MSYHVINLTKVPGTDPQEFQLFVKDTENTKSGYRGRLECGTEEAVREALALGGMAQQQIDLWFRRAM